MAYSINEMSEIIDGLYLSSMDVAMEQDTLKEYSIRTVISLIKNCSTLSEVRETFTNIDFYHFEIDDDENEDLLSLLDRTFEIINESLSNKRNILIHCALGVSRSSATVIGYLMRSKHCQSFNQAYRLVKSKRSIIDPNFGFRKQLALYEQINCQLNMSNVWLRRYYYQRISELQLRDNDNDQKTANYLLKFQQYYSEQTTEQQPHPTGQTVYKCKTCKNYLFNQNDVIPSDDDPSGQADNIYLLISKFIAENSAIYFDPTKRSGKIDCPKCSAKLGRYDWLKPFGYRICTFTIQWDDEHWSNTIELPLALSVNRSKVDSMDQ